MKKEQLAAGVLNYCNGRVGYDELKSIGISDLQQKEKMAGSLRLIKQTLVRSRRKFM